MKKLLLTFLAVFTITMLGNAQEIRMTDGTVTACTGDFTDTGGLAGDYSDDENLTLTICSPFATDDIQVSFQLWNVGGGDLLIVYDGDTATGAPLGVFNSGIVPNVLLTSAANTTGCMTFRWISNSSAVAPGWQATIACIDNCQTISNTVTTTPARDADGVLRVCQGETVQFSGSSTFSVDGTGATSEYRLADGTVVAGTTASETYFTPGIYVVDYVTFDSTGCRDRQLEDVTILVSTTPDFTGTQAADSSICFGESTVITGQVETTQFLADVAPPVTGQTFLPDGNGVAYQTCIDVTGFPSGSTFSAVNDILSFFINMEHSYMGDLDIVLTAPNGSQVRLLTFPNGAGSTYLGVPIDVDTDLNPGTGFLYTFTEGTTATQTMAQAAGGFGTTLPAADYRPEDPFSNFLGSSLNGLWCLDIVDNLGSDNGYIFEWGINFNPAIVPTAGSYQPGEVTEAWTTNPDITAVNGSDITVTPTASGQNCYDFELVDSFGCTYVETVCIDVAPEITSAPAALVVCQNGGTATVDLTSQDDVIRNGLSSTDFTVTYFNSDADAQADLNGITTPDAVSVTGSQIYYARVFDAVSGCFAVEQVDVTLDQVTFDTVPDLELCDDLTGDGFETFDLTSQATAIIGTQNPADVVVAYFNTQMDADLNQNEITTPSSYDNIFNPEIIYVRVSNLLDEDCFATGSFNIVVLALPAIGTAADITVCDDVPIDNSASIDLVDLDDQILNGQNFAENNVSYHANAADADAGTNPLSSSYTAADGEQIFARLTNIQTGCHNVSSFFVTVEGCEVIIPEGFSPNGDGVNDTFSIPNIEQYPNFELMIFNRYGSKIYETRGANYEEFAGIPNSGTLAGDGLLPVGTYFYVIKYNDPNIEDVSSWVYINY